MCLRCLEEGKEEDVSFGYWVGRETKSGGVTGYYDGVAIAGKLYGFHSAIMAGPSFGCDALLDIPEEDLAIASYAGEARVVGCDGYVQDRVAMRFVFLDRGCGLDCCLAIGVVWSCARKVDCSV